MHHRPSGGATSRSGDRPCPPVARHHAILAAARAVPVHGALWLDEGAVRAVRDKRKSLFSAGIVRVVGEFNAQDAVTLCDGAGHEFGRGLANYNAEARAQGWGCGSGRLDGWRV